MPVHDVDDQRSRSRKRRRLTTAGLGALVLLGVLTFRKPLFQGNFGVVDPGLVYRSAQPRRELPALIRERKLASILNLRGGSAADAFYAEEVHAADAQRVGFYDFPMSATRRPSRRELLTLLDLFDHCRYPLLIHCKSGSDRTGLASAVYLLARRGFGPDRALEAFTLRHGHVGLIGTERLHEPFDEYRAWLSNQRLAHTPERFRGWVEHDYNRGDPSTAFRPLRPGPRATLAAKPAAKDAL